LDDLRSFIIRQTETSWNSGRLVLCRLGTRLTRNTGWRTRKSHPSPWPSHTKKCSSRSGPCP